MSFQRREGPGQSGQYWQTGCFGKMWEPSRRICKGVSQQESQQISYKKLKETYPISDLVKFSQDSLNGVRRESTEPVKAFTSHRRLERTEFFLAFTNITISKRSNALEGRKATINVDKQRILTRRKHDRHTVSTAVSVATIFTALLLVGSVLHICIATVGACLFIRRERAHAARFMSGCHKKWTLEDQLTAPHQCEPVLQAFLQCQTTPRIWALQVELQCHQPL